MEYLWAPWRSIYVKEKPDRQSCVFCIAAGSENDEETLVIHRGAGAFVMLNRYPYTSGHLMIAPYQHVSRLGQVELTVLEEIARMTQTAERVLEGIYRPGGLNLGMNLGEAAGAGIEQHIHLHVLPRWMGDANFMTTVGNTRVIPETLETTYAKVRAAFVETTSPDAP